MYVVFMYVYCKHVFHLIRHTAYAQVDCLEWLLDHGGSVRDKDNLGGTPLHDAAEQGQVILILMISLINYLFIYKCRFHTCTFGHFVHLYIWTLCTLVHLDTLYTCTFGHFVHLYLCRFPTCTFGHFVHLYICRFPTCTFGHFVHLYICRFHTCTFGHFVHLYIWTLCTLVHL